MTGDNAFRFPVADLIGEPGKHRDVTIDTSVDWALELSRVGPRLEADLTLHSAMGGVVVRGRVETTATHTCHRCLSEWEEPVVVDMNEVLGIDDEDGYPIEGEVADLEPPIRDAVLLALPLTPTCREGCLGLCAVCGADLNVGSHTEHDEDDESPFASLRGLLEPRDSGKG